MRRVLLIGNPNVGKSTLFNSLTKSAEHTGNFHGVTVEEKRKVVRYDDEEYEFVDLPGLYSMNTFSFEEEISRREIMRGDSLNLVLVDANTIKRNLYLCLQLIELNINFKILINNCNKKININKLSINLNKKCEIINAKKEKLNKKILNIREKTHGNNYKIAETYENNTKIPQYLTKYIKLLQSKLNIDENKIILAINGIFDGLNPREIELIKSLYPDIIKDRYDYLDHLLEECNICNDKVYGESRADKWLLNPAIMTLGFITFFLLSIYIIFFLVGPFISDLLTGLIDFIIINPFMNFLYMITDNIWLIEFFRSGVFSSVLTVVSFVPQVCLLFIFITILEDSGIIARMAYVFDDFLSLFGLNGKAIYLMLLGLGCNTMSTLACRNMSEKNMKIKTALLNPYISCMARLPVFVLIASAFFGIKSYFVVVGLYLLGLAVALILGAILNKTILKSNNNNLLLEFPPMRKLDIKHIAVVAEINAIDMIKRVFTVVLCVGVIVWILTHTMFNLNYTEVITDSILYSIADKISIIFKPIGLNSAGVVCALITGLMAKELIVSTISISNNVSTQSALISSLALTTSVVHFSLPSAVSFLIFVLLYCPCVSNMAVLKREVGSFYMWFSIISQITIAYMISFVAYHLLTRGLVSTIIALIVISIILFAIIYIIKKVKHSKCLTCGRCK